MKSKLSRVTLAALFLILLYVPGLAWLGRYSLPVYLLHQPVIYFSVLLIKNRFL